MAEPKQKDGLDIAIDFFFGAVAGDLAVAAFFSRRCQQFYQINFHTSTVLICLLAATLIFGSLAALYRNQFWSRCESYSIIPPMEETVSRAAKSILWMLFALGCASLGLLLIS
jgi:hypothetical protein